MSAHGPHELRCDPTHRCITCSDEGVPMRVVTCADDPELATCENARGERSDILTGLIGPVAPGDLLLVHAGAALARIPSHTDLGSDA